MFTGLVEEVGSVISKKSTGSGFTFSIKAYTVLEGLKTGDSVNVNGVCQTVTSVSAEGFSVDTVAETLKKTNFGSLQSNSKVNLERSLMPNSRMGGHFVLGHTDTTGIIRSIKSLNGSYELVTGYPSEFASLLVYAGSITVDGVSLTLASVENESFRVAVIPHTWENTIFRYKAAGDTVNLEFDVLGKYVQKFLAVNKPENKITEQWLREQGF